MTFLKKVLAASQKQNEILNTIEDGTCEDQDWDEDCLRKWGDTPYFFEDPKPLPKNTWLIHYTKNPEDIVKDGFHGAHLQWLGLTKGGGPRKPGHHALAYRLTKENLEEGTGRIYGEHAVVFQSDDAVEAHHKSDEENQVIFFVSSVKNKMALRKKDKTSFIVNVAGKEEVVPKGKLLTFLKSLQNKK